MLKVATGTVLIDVYRMASAPSAGGGRTASNATESAIAFGKLLSFDGAMRARIGDKKSWESEFNAWKKGEHDAQRLRSGGAKEALIFLSHLKNKDCVYHGLPRRAPSLNSPWDPSIRRAASLTPRGTPRSG